MPLRHGNDSRIIDISSDVIDFDVPEMFASKDLKVISYKGANYYKACGATVWEKPSGGRTSCIKPVGHIRWAHEDGHGNKFDGDFGIQDMDSTTRTEAARMLRLTGIEDSEIFNVLNALQYAGFTLERETKNG